MKVAKLDSGAPEIFYTIQGEGISIGKPSIFLRLSLCNLHCRWCDTPYTWNWENTPWETVTGTKYSKEKLIIDLSVSEIISQLEKYHCKHLVITGGEPLIQQKEISELIQQLGSDWSVEVETNGTLIPDELESIEGIQFNVSPKLSHSGNSAEIALKEKPLKWFSNHHNSSFKFVISSERDLTEIQSIQEKFKIPAGKIILMPEGNSSEKLRLTSPKIISICMEHQYRFSDRLHVHIWGNTRAK